MTLREAFVSGEAYLAGHGVDDARLDAWYLLEYVTGVSRTEYYMQPERPLAAEEMRRYEELLAKRGEHIPLQRLTGEQEFMGMPFKVDEDVFIPRQDTETLAIEALLKTETCPEISGKIKVLDLCTGSGCVLLSIMRYASRKGVYIEGKGADISEKALEAARRNARASGLRAEFLESDLFENIEGKYSIIVCNPPYIKTGDIDTLMEEVRLHEPAAALDGGGDGLYFYRKIVSQAGRYLADRGSLLFEIGYDQGESVKNLMCEAGYLDVCVRKDLAGLDRVVTGTYDSGRTV